MTLLSDTGGQAPTHLVPPRQCRECTVLDDETRGQGVTVRRVFRRRERRRQVSRSLSLVSILLRRGRWS